MNEEQSEDNKKKGIAADGLGNACCCLLRRRRYYLAILLFWGYVFNYATRVNLSVAILYITGRNNETSVNSTQSEFEWNETMTGYLLASFFYGYILTQIPGGYLSGLIGGNHVLQIGITGSGLLSFVAPIAAIKSFPGILIVRIACGLLQGLTIPAANALWSKWAPPMERTILSGFAISGNFLSSMMVMPVCGLIGNYLGWEWMFYIYAILSVVWGLIWFFTVFASPAKDKFISEKERTYIQESLGDRSDVKIVHPWLRLLRSPAVWAIIVAHTGHNWGFYTVLLYGVKFFKETVGYDVYASSMFTGLSFAICGLLIELGSSCADAIRTRNLLSTVKVRKLFCCFGFSCQTVFMLFLAFIHVKELAVASVILAIGSGGITWSGFYANGLDIAAPHSAIITALSNTFATIPGIISPYITSQSLPAKDPELSDWMWIWNICAIIYCLAATFFAIFARGERQSWVFTPPENT